MDNNYSPKNVCIMLVLFSVSGFREPNWLHPGRISSSADLPIVG
jgi:hypothetical protein